MTLGRESYNGPIHFCCDECGEIADTHCSDFDGALAKVKSRGWRVLRDPDGGWNHFCRDCAKADAA